VPEAPVPPPAAPEVPTRILSAKDFKDPRDFSKYVKSLPVNALNGSDVTASGWLGEDISGTVESEEDGALVVRRYDGTRTTVDRAQVTDIAPTTPETPSDTTTEPATGGAGVPVATEPAAVSTPAGAGVVEPTGVVPPAADAGQPVVGEGAEPSAVTAPAPAPAPEYTEEDIDRAVELGIFTEEQAESYREALRGEEAPQTAMGLAFERQISDIKARMDALKQKNGRAPAPKSPKRKEYDALKAQLDTLVTAETGDLAKRLKKMEASGVIGVRGERPVIDIDAVKKNLLGARAKPSMYQAVLAYIGVDTDGNYLPTTYSREEAAELAGLGRGSGANVSRVAQAMGIDAEAISRFHAGQTDIIVRGKDVSEAGTGATDLQPSRGVLYEAPKKNKPGRAVGFLRDALTPQGTLDFSKLPLNSKKATKDSPAVTGLAEIYARASNYDPKRGSNEEIIKQLNAEIAARVKVDRKGMQNALDRAYRVVRAEEEAQQEAEVESDTEEDVEPTVREGRTGARRLEGEEKASLGEEGADGPQYRTIPQSPVVTDRISDAELNKIVSDIEKALGGKLDITILDDVIDVDNKQAPGSRAGALIRGKIYLFRSGIAKGIEGQKTIFHEVFHKGLRNLLSPAEYRALMTKFYNQSTAVRQAADAYLASETGKADTKGLSPQEAKVLAVEESLAEMAEATDLSGSALRQLGNFFARLADRFGMPNLARAIRTMGLDPLQAFIREAIQAGIRPSVGEGVTRFRPGAPAFDRWFGDSKVVNAKGKPKVMYHGTARDVTGFRAKQAGAIFVTEDPRFAAGFSEMSQSWMLNNYRSILTDKQIEAARNAVPRILEQEGYKGAEAASLQRQIDNNAPTGAAQAIWEAALKEQMPTGPNVMPLYVKAENPFDYQNENHLARLRAWDYQNRYISIPGTRRRTRKSHRRGHPRTHGW
jgi:hypothetical protein